MPQTPTPQSVSPAAVSPTIPHAARLPASPEDTNSIPVSVSVVPTVAAPRPSPLSPHESHTRQLTSADRSTAYSPTQKTTPWQATRAHASSGIKHEDDGASSTAPSVSPSSPLVPFQHYPSQQHYQYPSQYHEQSQYQPPLPSVPYLTQGGALPPPGPYPSQAPYPYPQQNSFSRTTVNIHLHQQHQHQHHYPTSRTPGHPPRCECSACAGSGLGHVPPISPPALELAREAVPMSWGHDTSLDGEALMEPSDWQGTHQGEASKRSHWHDARTMGHVQPQGHSQHAPIPSMIPGAYSPGRAAYMQEVPRWGDPPFEYGLPPQSSMYTPIQHAGPSGPSTSPNVSWSLPQSSRRSEPSPPAGQPPSPPYPKQLDKPAKHKSRKTWTEVEWRKLTELAERSKRGNPENDIDWDFVTSGFGGRRCRQGILTVAAKRGLKVSTREARTIGKRARSTEEPDGAA